MSSPALLGWLLLFFFFFFFSFCVNWSRERSAERTADLFTPWVTVDRPGQTGQESCWKRERGGVKAINSCLYTVFLKSAWIDIAWEMTGGCLWTTGLLLVAVCVEVSCSVVSPNEHSLIQSLSFFKRMARHCTWRQFVPFHLNKLWFNLLIKKGDKLSTLQLKCCNPVGTQVLWVSSYS